MISDARLAQLAAATYSATPTFTGIGLNQSLHAVVTTEDDGLTVVAFRGSIEPHDWALDFQAIPAVDHEVAEHPTLGCVHAGFLNGALALAPQVAAAVAGKPYALTGHSLGGALALVMAGLLADSGHAPMKVATFGAPKVGFPKFVAAVSAIPIAEYRRGNDIVPLVPFWLVQCPYEHARMPMIRVGQVQANPIECHHIAGYVADVTAYFG